MDGKKKTLTKADLVERVYDKIGFSKKEASEAVELVFNEMKRALHEDGKLKLSGFGRFDVNEKKPRRGRNPQTGESMTIEGRKVVGFKPSPLLRARVNGQSLEGLKEDWND